MCKYVLDQKDLPKHSNKNVQEQNVGKQNIESHQQCSHVPFLRTASFRSVYVDGRIMCTFLPSWWETIFPFIQEYLYQNPTNGMISV